MLRVLVTMIMITGFVPHSKLTLWDFHEPGVPDCLERKGIGGDGKDNQWHRLIVPENGTKQIVRVAASFVLRRD